MSLTDMSKRYSDVHSKEGAVFVEKPKEQTD
jgi:hypothetical protein